MQREDNAMREFQRMAGAGAGIAELGAMTDRQRSDLEMSDVMLQGRPFTPDPAGGYMTSGAERANARTQARRTQGTAPPPAPPRPPEVPEPRPRPRRGLGLPGIFAGAP